MLGIATAAADGQSALDRLLRAALLTDYNTRVVVLGLLGIGISAAVVGTFLVMRRRALVAETLGHSTLAGVCAAPLLGVICGFTADGLALSAGGMATGVLAIVLVQGVSRMRGVRVDSALAVVLATFFGIGTFLLGIVQQLDLGKRVALDGFIEGKASAMGAAGAMRAGVLALVVVVAITALLPRLRLLAFDRDFARARGMRPERLDSVLTLLTAAVAAVGMQAVGLILIVALFIGPPIAARTFTRTLGGTLVAAGSIGALAAYVGGVVSAAWPRMPTGPLVVLASTTLLGIALAFGPNRPSRRLTAEVAAP